MLRRKLAEDLFAGFAARTNAALGAFTAAHGAGLDTIRNSAMCYALLPLRIGLDQAVLPMTWGFQWTSSFSMVYLAVSVLVAGVLALKGRLVLGVVLLIAAAVLLVGVVDMPWPFVLVAAAALGWADGGWPPWRWPCWGRSF